MNTMQNNNSRVQNEKIQNKNNNSNSDNLTQLLHHWHAGDQQALNKLIEVTYQQLCLFSRRLMRNEQHYHTLQTEALLHEAYFRLRDLKQLQWRDRNHFFSVWSGIMRRLLIDSARKSHAEKRGGKEKPVSLHDINPASAEVNAFNDLYEAIDQLKQHDAVKARIVELRYFIGLSIEEISTLLEISPATVKRKWSFAKAWLYKELEGVQC